MIQSRHNLHLLLLVTLLVCGCGKVTPDQEAQNHFDKAEFEDAIRTAGAIVDKSMDKEVVYEMQVLIGRSRVELAHRARKSGKEDEAVRHLDQALVVLTAAIEFEDVDHLAYYTRATAHKMLDNKVQAYKDNLAGKALDPAAQVAYTNEFVPDYVRLEQQHAAAHDSLNERSESPEGMLSENDEESEANRDPFSTEPDRDESYTYENDRSKQDRFERDSIDPASDESERSNGEKRDRNRFAFSPNGDDSGDETGDAGPAEPGADGERRGGRRRNSLTGDSVADSPESLEPSPDEDDRDENPLRTPFPYLDPKHTPPTFAPPRPPSTGITGNHSRLQPNFNPSLPTTGYSGGPLASGPNGMPPQSSGRGALATGPTGPTTGYSGSRYAGAPPTNFNRAPSYLPLPSAGSGQNFGSTFNPSNGNFGYSGALPFSERAQFGQQAAPLTIPYQAPQKLNDPYSNVPTAPTMRDFYTPPPITPHAVPTTSIYGQ